MEFILPILFVISECRLQQWEFLRNKSCFILTLVLLSMIISMEIAHMYRFEKHMYNRLMLICACVIVGFLCRNYLWPRGGYFSSQLHYDPQYEDYHPYKVSLFDLFLSILLAIYIWLILIFLEVV